MDYETSNKILKYINETRPHYFEHSLTKNHGVLVDITIHDQHPDVTQHFNVRRWTNFEEMEYVVTFTWATLRGEESRELGHIILSLTISGGEYYFDVIEEG